MVNGPWSMFYVLIPMFGLPWCAAITVHRSSWNVLISGDLFLNSNVVLTYLLMLFAQQLDLNPPCRHKNTINISHLPRLLHRHFLSFDIPFQFFIMNSVLVVVWIDTGGVLVIPDSNHMHDTNAFANTHAYVT